MEIHAPHGHVQSFRDVAVHLAIVTVGILIALGLEQAVEWYHHRELADEARETIRNELRNNKSTLDRQLANFPKFRADAVKAFHFISDYKDHGKTKIEWTGAFYYSAPLRSTSWSTAQTVGALAFMPYSEVEKFAALYRAQEDYLAAQDITYEALISAAGIISAQKQVSDDAAAYYRGISQGEYETARTRIMTALASLSSQLNKAERLDRQYGELLGGKSKNEKR
ncbi:MAG: hypothetical protein JO099_09250 [Acidobacteriia bacterium]|nr:hypothetical protein [Terriglobia bacterium]